MSSGDDRMLVRLWNRNRSEVVVDLTFGNHGGGVVFGFGTLSFALLIGLIIFETISVSIA